MKIAIFGSGYVGLVAGACFAETGNSVTCIDIDIQKIANLKNGILPIYEPGLTPLLQKNINLGRLQFTTDAETAVQHAQVIFIAVSTPQHENGSADLKYVLKVAETIGQSANGYKVIVDKSTVPVGTADKVRAVIKEYYSGEFDVVSNPEFLKEGTAIEDFMKPDRVVIGTDSEHARLIMRELYAPFFRSGERIFFMSARSAEMTKYAANAMLATRIIFMNDVADLCEVTGANVNDVRKGIGSDSRIGKAFLYPGMGYGGSCFPKDTSALVTTGDEHNVDMAVVKSVIAQNEVHKKGMVKKVLKYFGDVSGKKFAVWGLAFKSKTDDIRESAAIVTIRELLAKGALITVYDPEAMASARLELGDSIAYADSMYAAVDHVDALIICTDWKDFMAPDFERLKKLMKSPLIFDGRNLYDAVEGFEYFSKGR